MRFLINEVYDYSSLIMLQGLLVYIFLSKFPIKQSSLCWNLI